MARRALADLTEEAANHRAPDGVAALVRHPDKLVRIQRTFQDNGSPPRDPGRRHAPTGS